MTLSDRYSILFEPIKVGPHTAKNRFWSTPHAIGYGIDNVASQAGVRSTRAAGGWGVVFTEANTISPDMDKTPFKMSRMWDEGDVRNQRFVVDEIRRNGALAGIELEYNVSVNPMAEGRGLQPKMVSGGIGDSGLSVAYAGTLLELDREGIEEIKQIYVSAALRARDAGFDLVTFHAGHAASIIAHFLIPYYNTRTDEYGGSVENRTRFAREMLQAVRDAVGPGIAFGLRLGVDTLDEPIGLGDRGLRSDGDTPEVIKQLDDLVDYWDFVPGVVDWGIDAQSSRTVAENHEKKWVDGLKAFTTKPVVNVGRFNSPDTMVEVLKSGQCDFIGAARAGIADPYLPEKVRTNNIGDIRECIGCNICVSRDMISMPLQCTQNATAGEEFRRGWNPENFTPAKNRDEPVLIIGAGPAGMECAMILGKRGFENVHLVEKDSKIGGSINWVSNIPGRHEWRRLVEYRELQLSQLDNVEVILNTEFTAEEALEYGAGIIIAATGSHYMRNGIDPYNRLPIGLDPVYGERVLTPEQVVRDGVEVGKRVVVVDYDGYFMGPGIAEMLAKRGCEVVLATRGEHIGEYQRYTLEISHTLRDLRDLGVKLRTETSVIPAGDSKVALVSPDWQEEFEFDNIVLVGPRTSDNGLFKGLLDRRNEWAENDVSMVHRIGDSVRPHFIAEAIFSGHRLAREIDSENPAKPLPFIRERRIIDATPEDYQLGAKALSSIY
ncbi:FAD-dependent oxidoreductase [Leucobacter denitrificans]|uniref:FAD-dependent oxidoreductase n=1 Tax=Leucobacter denitrificans TaxID=683042 RepID=A0A7G9S293_9MICO|nr:FAD-dependent oxidoreductase [Leucobacter denitrificans]QNN61968.1 FAD-dependent oxidoreductase [Leucobacter denitrificans]